MLCLFLLIGAAAMLVHVHGAGRLLGEKTRLTNAVDASAYSGALAQARALNFLAYTNRAMVAHQVAMAHLVTLASWARFGDTEARQFAASNPPSTLLGGLFGPSHGLAYTASAPLAGTSEAYVPWGRGQLATAFADHDRLVHDVLAQAQSAVQGSLADSRMRIMDAVFRANYPGVDKTALSLTLVSDTLDGFVARQGGDARGRLKGLVETAAGTYGFLAPRDHTAMGLYPTEARCPWLRHELRRRGATDLLGFDTWQSLDTQSFHALRSNQWIGCYYREYPMGYGALQTAGGAMDGVEYVDAPPDDFGDEDFWRWVDRYAQWDIHAGSANPLANSYAVQERVVWRGRGLPAFARLGARALSSGEPTLRFAVVGAFSPPDRGPAAGRLRSVSSLAGGRLAAIGAAESFYQRPGARSDGRYELASLFMPYWHARLAPVTDAERTQARAMQGVQ